MPAGVIDSIIRETSEAELVLERGFPCALHGIKAFTNSLMTCRSEIILIRGCGCTCEGH